MSDYLTMRIYLNEFTETGHSLQFTQDDLWVTETVSHLDENLVEGAAPTSPTEPRQIEAEFSFRKVDDIYLVNGHANAPIHLNCSRCTIPFDFNAHPKFTALYCRDPKMAGISGLADDEKRVSGQTKGFARHAHDSSQDEENSNDTLGNVEITYITDEFVDLEDVLLEQLQLQVPFQPLCKQDCKGLCARCGEDLNTSRCNCPSETAKSPFSVLKDMKLRGTS